MYLGIEIGGTKLQVGLGDGAGQLLALWRGTVVPAEGSAGILRQLQGAIPQVLAQMGVAAHQLRAAGIGFGGPTDDASQTVITSHQIAGWDHFPLAAWLRDLLGGVPAVLCNDADVAGLAEATYGTGRGLSPLFYMTIGSGIGGGLILNGTIYRGAGQGAAEIGHVPVNERGEELEAVASGWGLASQARRRLERGEPSLLTEMVQGDWSQVTGRHVTEAAARGDALAQSVLDTALDALAFALDLVIRLLCPRRIVIGGGVSLLGEERLFQPLRQRLQARVFPPFRGLTDIVPAQLGEEVVVHGAIALARQLWESSRA
ncbi:ROK family protein [Thermogemmata fonticola]|uniref:ROK family protein n=1 Tax=Thermogemmata fonticola TaxID=2755323 RepID=A0A7V9AD62_9BACT|nr:ROK family protein [Thermogemmata fonticola]MBA2227913.1 ROK family protein [Thermogemmata fonticola]